MAKIYLDTETCGLHGFAVLMQYAIEDGETILFSPWTEPVSETLELIEVFCENEIIGFNLSFDWFHICKLYTTFSLFEKKKGMDAIPMDHIELIAQLEKEARDGPCLKPKSAFDIMLHARKGKYQSTMDRKDIKIKRVPTVIAKELADELNQRVKLNDVYFARKKIESDQWQVFPHENSADFRDVVLKFAPSSALKALAVDALNLKEETVLLHSDVSVEARLQPEEIGWAPYALAVGNPKRWKGAWPDVIRYHISHWTYNELARKYAFEDVDRYTRPLYKYFGSPQPGDEDSILACMVGAVRWRGFKIDLEGIKKLREKEFEISKSAPKDPGASKKWLSEVMEEAEQVVLTSTKATILEEISEWNNEAGKRAKMILAARKATKKIELYDKLLIAERFHASFKVIGTRSSRMSGTDGLNAQGIDRTKEVRSQFPLAWNEFILCGGDFVSFEVCLADAAYNDPLLREDLMQGKKIHALFGESLFPEEDYESILASKGTEDDKYDKSKRSVFAILYGGTEETIKHRIGIPIEQATEGYRRFVQRYKKVGEERRKVFDMFCLPKDTWVLTKEGPRQIKDLLNIKNHLIVNGFCYNSSKFFYTGEKEIYEIETKEGHKIKASKEHLFLVNYFQNLKLNETGFCLWTAVKELKIGMKLVLNNHQNFEWEGEGDFNSGYILGWLFGDGSIPNKETENRLYFYCGDFCMLTFVSKLFKTCEIKYIPENNCYYIISDEIENIKQQFGVDCKKEITSFIEEASSEFYVGFLSGFFDTDGSAKKQCKEVTLHQSNLKCLEIIQRMLLRFGICSNIYKLRNPKNLILGRKCNIKQPYRLYIGASNVIIFAKRIGFQNPIKQQNILKAIEKCDKKKLYREDFLTEIKNIKLIGKEDVYDVTVPNISCFDANGFMSHNCSMRQPGGIGTAVEWHEPADYIESLLGFKRYFTLENRICKALFDMAQKPPANFKNIKVKVVRRDREQTATGATQSALYGAAFAIQAANMRAAANHVIQSTGATITKLLQVKLWELQPIGINKWNIMPMNIHDEIMTPMLDTLQEKASVIVKDFVESMRPKVPLIEIEWKNNLKNWSEK